MNRRRLAVVSVGSLLVMLLGAAAPAEGKMGIRAGLKPAFGFGGEGETKTEQGGQTTTSEADLEPTVGFALFGEYRIIEYFSAGLLMGFHWWLNEDMDDADMDRNTLIDISVLPRGHYGLLDDKLEIYAAVPVGLSISVASDDYEDSLGADPGTGVGANVGVLAGALYRVWRSLDVFLELGYQYHWVQHDYTVLGQSIEASVSGGQFALNFGAAWTL